MNIAFSPCPNDTFVFHAWGSRSCARRPEAGSDVCGYRCDQSVGRERRRAGSAENLVRRFAVGLVGLCLVALRGCLGERLRTLDSDIGRSGNRSDSAFRTPVAVPSEKSTAYLLFRLWAARHVPGGLGEIRVMPFHEIMPAVRDGRMDAGLVIHEARFTYPSYGLRLVADLGSWWEEDTGLPIPLGAIIAHRSLDRDRLAGWIRSSVEYAWAHPDASKTYVMQHAQEMSEDVARAPPLICMSMNLRPIWGKKGMRR